MDALVTPAWLAAHLAGPDLRVADATWFLPGDARDAAAEHARAHIPGAVFLDLDAFADPASPLPMMLPPRARFAARMATLGLGDGTRIVLYDDSPHHTAARGWAMLRAFGIDAAILDGGLAAWRAEGRAMASGVEHRAPTAVTIDAAATGIRTLADVRDAAATGTAQIVDARSPARFAGSEPEPRAGVEPGHIPDSTNLHYARLFDADGRWLRDAALAAAFTDAGVDIDRPIVATCGSGVTAAVVAFAAHLLGRNAAIYDGSWAEWGADPSTPKARA